MASIKTAKAGTILIKRKSITLLNISKRWQSWQAGSPSPPQGTKPAAEDIKGRKAKIPKKIIKNIFLTGFIFLHYTLSFPKRKAAIPFASPLKIP